MPTSGARNDTVEDCGLVFSAESFRDWREIFSSGRMSCEIEIRSRSNFEVILVDFEKLDYNSLKSTFSTLPTQKQLSPHSSTMSGRPPKKRSQDQVRSREQHFPVWPAGPLPRWTRAGAYLEENCKAIGECVAAASFKLQTLAPRSGSKFDASCRLSHMQFVSAGRRR